jgi:hypothetical protein
VNHRAQLLILAQLIVLAILAFFFWPAPAASDAPVVSSVVPAADFLPLDGNSASDVVLAPANEARTANPGPRLAGQGDPSGDKSPRRLAEARTPSPSARAVPSVAPVPAAVVATPDASAPGPRLNGVRASTAGHSIRGDATWYRYVPGGAAAGPRLRAALGPGWRGTRVTVTGPAGTVRVVLSDFMRADKLIDLSSVDFPAVCGALSRGICEAKVTW